MQFLPPLWAERGPVAETDIRGRAFGSKFVDFYASQFLWFFRWSRLLSRFRLRIRRRYCLRGYLDSSAVMGVFRVAFAFFSTQPNSE